MASILTQGELWVALPWGFCDLVVKFVSLETNIVYTIESQSMRRGVEIRDQRAGYDSQSIRFLIVTLDKVTPKVLSF